MKQLRIITNADDFGFSREVNAAVVEAHRFGTLTSCSLMVAEDSASEAVSLAKSLPRLSVGIHLVTVLGKSVLPHKEIPSLVDHNGRFPSDPTATGIKYAFSSGAKKELKRELNAQVEAFLATGLTPTHMDSHLHMHIHPVIFEIALELAVRHGIGCMRVPQDRLEPALKHDPTRKTAKAASALIFQCLAHRMKSRLKEKNIRFTERVYGHFMTGKMNEQYVLSLLEGLPRETAEIYFHPALHAPSASLIPEKPQGLKEHEILMSTAFKNKIKEQNIDLISYRELERER